MRLDLLVEGALPGGGSADVELTARWAAFELPPWHGHPAVLANSALRDPPPHGRFKIVN